MKKAFTIIEIVMVMIILVVLASLAVPKLITKKVDAQVAKAVISMKMHINKVSTYYIMNGEFATSSSEGGGECETIL
ncbi:prepilin-type N-terminal cleavage/methylation domain-containing protein [Campylobacter fetus]|uniref:prepilin-type N-terminal cleavage/methylation domain-containing protein n=1 Tax=Campylobacter fetus TaxID=196 RepID=UPI000818979A|nr:prepilin-type N-terminal cleavage/methylation domain-containing protein [Campylobacter fetus]